MWPVYLEYMTSLLWSYAMAATFVLFALTMVHFPLPRALQLHSLLPGWTGVFIGSICMMQTCVSMALDKRYDRGLFRNYSCAIWYPLAFWLLNMSTAIVAFPKALFRQKGKRAIWVSPDRGVRA